MTGHPHSVRQQGHPDESLYYINLDHPPPTAAEMTRRLARDRALQQWHNSAVNVDFEVYFRGLSK